jgi:anti-sigma regulatory factor (Ser/Thr protein kinase)
VHVERSFLPTAEAPRAVRAWIRELLQVERLAPLEHTASLLVTELVTNAVLHARTPLTVAVEMLGDGLRVSVADDSPTGPTVRTYDADATTGRGLHLVDVLSARWGIEPRPSGKAVWCDLVAPTDEQAGVEWADFATDTDAADRSDCVG